MSTNSIEFICNGHLILGMGPTLSVTNTPKGDFIAEDYFFPLQASTNYRLLLGQGWRTMLFSASAVGPHMTLTYEVLCVCVSISLWIYMCISEIQCGSFSGSKKQMSHEIQFYHSWSYAQRTLHITIEIHVLSCSFETLAHCNLI